MIFVTIGTQAPFDRLIKAVDEIAKEIDEKIIVQALNGNYKPHNFEVINFIDPIKFSDIFSEANLIVAHAGMGTIISALTNLKPIIVFPRKASLGEHRNEHQMATAKRLEALNLINVAYDNESLNRLILNKASLIKNTGIGNNASRSLIDSLSEFIITTK